MQVAPPPRPAKVGVRPLQELRAEDAMRRLGQNFILSCTHHLKSIENEVAFPIRGPLGEGAHGRDKHPRLRARGWGQPLQRA